MLNHTLNLGEKILSGQPYDGFNVKGLWKQVHQMHLFHVIAGFKQDADIARERGRIA